MCLKKGILDTPGRFFGGWKKQEVKLYEDRIVYNDHNTIFLADAVSVRALDPPMSLQLRIDTCTSTHDEHLDLQAGNAKVSRCA